jgi:hypothetical protein
VVELARLTSLRADLRADRVRGVTRLRAQLGSTFPALEAAFDSSTRSAPILVTWVRYSRRGRPGPGTTASWPDRRVR